jgi:hypothetical protein
MTIKLEQLIRECEHWLATRLPLLIQDSESIVSSSAQIELFHFRYISRLLDLFRDIAVSGASAITSIKHQPIRNALERDVEELDGFLDRIRMTTDDPLRPLQLRKTLQQLSKDGSTPINSRSAAKAERDGRCVKLVDRVLKAFDLVDKLEITRNDKLLVEHFGRNPKMILAQAFVIDRATVLSVCNSINGRDQDRAYVIVGKCLSLKPATVRKIYERRRRAA